MRALYSVGGNVPLGRVLREHRAALVPLGIVLAANVVVLLLLVLPLSRSVTAKEEQATKAERDRVVAQAESKRAEALRDGKVQATTDLETFYQEVLPVNVAAARRILVLRPQQQAREFNVQFQSGITNEEEIEKSTLLKLSVQMRLSGEYDDIRALIYALETSPDFLVIEELRLAEGVDANAPLSVFLQVSTYYRSAQGTVARATSDGR